MPILEHLVVENIALNDFSIRALQLLTILLVDKFITIPASYHPATLFKYIALQLSKKVNTRSANHQKIAGQLSLLLLLSLALGFTWIILYFAATSWFFELILLWLMIASRTIFNQTTAIKRSLKLGHKILAREQLDLMCIRDTTSLSTIGLVKATIEALPQRLVLSYFNPILIFGCLGIYPTVFAVTLSGLAQCWNPKLAQYSHFGRTAMKLSNIGLFVTRCLVSVNILILFGTKISPVKIIEQAKHWHNLGGGLLLSGVGSVLNCSLGGAVIYQSIKIRRPEIGKQQQQPTIENIDDVNRVIRQVSNSWLFILLLALTTSLTINVLR